MRIDLAGFTRGAQSVDHKDLLKFCARMDALGYDGIWFNEFHFEQPPAPYPSTLLLASSILAVTERLRVGTSIVVLPLYHPLLLAEQVAQLHAQSNGRFDFGIGRGAFPRTFDVLGIAPETTRARFEDSFELMQKAWHGSVQIDPTHAWPSNTVCVGPLAGTNERIPVYLAGSTPDTIAFGARHKLPLLLSLEPPEQRQLDVYDQVTGNQSGRYPAEFSISRYVMIAATRQEAMQKVDALLPRIYERRLRYARAQNRPTDQIKPVDMETFLTHQMIAGSPQDCVTQLRALGARTGIESIRLIFNANGEVDEAEAENMATLFGKTALPELQAVRSTSPTHSNKTQKEVQ